MTTSPVAHRLRARLGSGGVARAADGEAAAAKQYYYVQDLVTRYNENCLEIKKWSVTTASIVAIIGQLGLRYLEPVLIVIIALAAGFWITETIWRMNQWAFIRLIREMEQGDPAGPQISAGWANYYLPKDAWTSAARAPERSLSGFMSHFIAPITSLPHALIAGFALIGLCWGMVTPIDLAGDKAKPLSGSFDVTLHGPARTMP